MTREWLAQRSFGGRLGLVILILMSDLTGEVIGQSGAIARCRVERETRAKYDLVSENPNTLPPYILSVNIVVKTGNFNDDYMKRLATTLAQRYCRHEQVS